MPATSRISVPRVTRSAELHLRSARGDRTLTAPQAFALGDSLIQARKYSVAAQVFSALADLHPERVEFSIMLARCQIGLKDYESSNSILKSLFRGMGRRCVDELQAAFIFQVMGMGKDAVAELRKVAERHPEMALLRLLLADSYARRGDPKLAVRCWKAAIRLDDERGCIAFVARRRLHGSSRAASRTVRVPPQRINNAGRREVVPLHSSTGR